ncbi:soluble lytic murein transglycosylase-like protein [Paraburkholderia sp. GAS448]|uniref:lytic transglycosylase domain-containing protein n=1 Tax=Paraburkholderia sp. GAS448 TaxID=3035136 RepID=UPI003D2215BE
MNSTRNLVRPKNVLLCATLALTLAAGAARADDNADGRHAAVVRILTSHFRLSAERAEHIVGAVEQAAGKLHVPISLILAIIQTESGFDSRATSSAGAIGLMQVMPATLRDFTARSAPPADIQDPAGNIYVGTSILRRYIDDADGDMQQALSRYSGGTRGYARRVYARWRYFSDFADPALHSARDTAFALRATAAGRQDEDAPDTAAIGAASQGERQAGKQGERSD